MNGKISKTGAEVIAEKTFSKTPAFRSVPMEADLEAAIRVLTAAEKPVIVAEEIGRNYPNALGLVGDAKLTLAALNRHVKEGLNRSQWVAHAQKIVRQWQSEYAPLFKSNSVPICPERLCSEIQEMLPDDAILVSDTGHAAIRTSTMIEFHHPDQRYIRCAGSLGWGFPASLGVKCALPDRPVICFTGDGGFWYHISELETACRCGINTVTVITICCLVKLNILNPP
jgi:acetolactate synthase-1/2/3 large subunit